MQLIMAAHEKEKRMKWIETIKVQSAAGKEQITLTELTFLASEIRENPDCQGLREATVLYHGSVPGCFSLLLFWDTDHPQHQGSLLGINLAQSLKIFGLVDHSVWIENIEKKGG
jgi:hypothetical protein